MLEKKGKLAAVRVKLIYLKEGQQKQSKSRKSILKSFKSMQCFFSLSD